jgi:hypothetical protein
MPRALAIILFLILTGETPNVYSGLVHTPLAYVEDLLFQPSFLKFPLWTYALIVMLLLLGGTGPRPRMRARPMDWAMLLSMACVALWLALGAARGGDLRQAGFQTFSFLQALAFAFLIMAVMRTPHHYAMLLKAIVAAAAYRSVMAVGVYVFVVRDLPWIKTPDCMTSHDDTVLFVTALVILLMSALLRSTKSARRLAWLLGPLILIAIQLNNRRLAWVSLVGALVAAYAAFPPERNKRQIKRLVLCVAPLLAFYVVIGWGRPERIFKPLQAFASVSSEQDLSTRSRDNENDGLIYTLEQNGALGTGFGHEYIETDTSLSARAFTQYRFIPHNSMLAVLAFTGLFGFTGILLPLPISVFLNVRTCRAAASKPIERVAAVVGVAEVAICINQMYGDMGFFSGTTLTILATAFATAGRLSAWSGAWPTDIQRPRS